MAENTWRGVLDLLAEMTRCETAGASIAALAMAFVCIDTMAYLAMPASRSRQTRDDFIDWVEAYLKAQPTQPYQYKGLDVYAARCAALHAFGPEAELHRKDPSLRKFAYTYGSRHHFNPSVSSDFVIIGIASFLDDVTMAVQSFLQKCLSDTELQARVVGRLETAFNILPYPKHSSA
jgi:hypothetical protein